MTPATINHEARLARRDEYMKQHESDMSELMDESVVSTKRRYLLMEENDDAAVWCSTHDSIVAACDAAVDTISNGGGSYLPIEILDLDTGEITPLTYTVTVKPAA